MTLKEAIERLNRSSKDVEAQKTLDSKTAGLSVILLGADGKIDYDGTIAAMEYCAGSDESMAPDCISFDEWKKNNQEKRMACPATGKALLNGRLRINRPNGLPSKSLNWGDVSEERRLLVAYRVETLGPIDPIAAHTAVSSSELIPEWKILSEEWVELNRLSEKTTSQKALIERVRSRLWYAKENQDDREKVLNFFEHSLAQYRVESVKTTSPNPPFKIVMLYARSDSSYVEYEFITQASAIKKSGIAEFRGIHDIELGTDSNASANAMLSDADVCLHFLSPDYLKTDMAESVRGLYVVHVPIRLRPCMLDPASYLMSKQAIPRSQSPVSTYRDRDQAWLEVVTDLRLILKGLGRRS